MRENPELLAALVKALPYPFLDGLKETIPRLYMEAEQAMSADPLLGPDGVEYAVPHYRRAIIEKAVRDLTKNTQIKAVVLPTTKSTAKYTMLQSGNFRLTVSYLNSPSGQIRGAEFRNTYSQLNKLLSQRSFDDFATDEPIAEIDSPIYCILIHGADPFDKRTPGFMKWAFPHPNGSGWIAEFDFSTVLQAASNLKPATQADGAHATLKKQKDEGTGDE